LAKTNGNVSIITATNSKVSSNVSQVWLQSSNLTCHSSNLLKSLRELVKVEENYVRTLQEGIENYVRPLDEPNLPSSLHGQRRNIFGNIERIYDFHARKFCPALKACGEDVAKIAETFNFYIREDYFYCYILFVMNRPRFQEICEENLAFFQV
jgi:RhoGEF domain